MILMDILIDALDFWKDFLTALIPSVCGILVYKGHISSEIKYEPSVRLLTFSISLMKSVVYFTNDLAVYEGSVFLPW